MNDKTDRQAPRNPRLRWLPLLGGVAIGFLLLGLLMPMFARPAARNLWTVQLINLKNLKQVSLALHMYLQENELPPKSLSDLANTKYVNQSGWSHFGQFTSPATKERIDWLYFPERISNDSDAKIIILASPKVKGGTRLVGFSDTTCRIVSDEEFSKLNVAKNK